MKTHDWFFYFLFLAMFLIPPACGIIWMGWLSRKDKIHPLEVLLIELALAVVFFGGYYWAKL